MNLDDERVKKIEELIEKYKQSDPLYDLRIEFGKLLMRNINDLSPKEYKRYLELDELLSRDITTT